MIQSNERIVRSINMNINETISKTINTIIREEAKEVMCEARLDK